MTDRIETIDFASYQWRCKLCIERGECSSDVEAAGAALSHLRMMHGLPGPMMMDRLPTSDEIDDAVDRWHQGDGKGIDLHEYLGWSWEDYGKWVQYPSFIPGPLRIWP